MTLERLKREEEAIASYDRAISINADYTAAWYGRGRALETLERYQEAIACFDQVIRLNPESEIAWFRSHWLMANG